MAPLDIPASTGDSGTFHKWLSGSPQSERLRDIRNSQRILRGLARCAHNTPSQHPLVSHSPVCATAQVAGYWAD